MRDSRQTSMQSLGACISAALVLLLLVSLAGQADSRVVETPAVEPASSRVGVEAIDAFIAEQEVDNVSVGWKLKLPKPPQVAFDEDASYYWMLRTNVGSMKVKLMPGVAPMHVSSTIYLTRLGFYDGLRFHRIIRRFMAQSGGPTGSGRRGPGYEYAGEFDEKVKHDKAGLLSMVNLGRPGTEGSQFLITFVPTPHLDGQQTIFGEVVEGSRTLTELERRGTKRGKPHERLVIEKAAIFVE